MARNVQGRYWIGTIPSSSDWIPPSSTSELPGVVTWMRGQQELGSETGHLHWQVCVATSRKVRLGVITSTFPGHWELTRSDAARDYVWKDETAVVGTRFELGSLAFRRSSSTDWDVVRTSAVNGDLSSVPSDVYVRCYNQLRRISQDHMAPVAVERTAYVFWGRTGTGKSRRAWEEAGLDAFAKDPRTKWWCGYRNQKNVVIDEFRGGIFLLIIDIGLSHMLRWLDRYPVVVETKGSAVPLAATTYWITSNLDPELWYPELDVDSKNALLRRLNITHFEYFLTLNEA